MSRPVGCAWATTEGQKLLSRVLAAAVRGQPVIMRNRRAGALEAIDRIASNDFACTVRTIGGEASENPHRSLAALASPGANSAAHSRLLELISSDELNDAVIVVEPDTRWLKDWIAFAGAFAKARQAFAGAAASLILLVADRLPAPAGCFAVDDDTIIDPLDALVFVRDQVSWPKSRLADVAAAALVEACRGDLDQIACFLNYPAERLFNPQDLIAALPATHDSRMLYWRGRDEACPIWLVQQNPEQLQHRIWRGQLSLIFPWLEEARAEFLSRCANLLPRGLCDKVSAEPLHVSDYEFSHISYGLRVRNADPSLVAAANTLRIARNELAHCRPLAVLDFKQVDEAIRILARAR